MASRHTRGATEFAATARRFMAEREAAIVSVDHLLQRTPREAWPALAQHPDILTLGALERLEAMFNEAVASDTHYALALAELGVSAAEALPQHAYPAVTLAQLRASAWKNLGKVYREMNRHPDAVQSFERAEAILKAHRHGMLAHDLAIIRFNLAVTLQELDRHDESLAILAECQEVFRGHNDNRLMVYSGIAEGVLLQRLRRYREAREVYLLLLASTKPIDKKSLAALHQAIGYASIELGDFTAAEANLNLALNVYREIGHAIDILKVELGRGRLLIRMGQHERGIAHLRPVRRRFLQNSIPEEAGLCGLEMVEALLQLERPTDAENLARKIVSEFTAAKLNNRAISALGILAEAIAARTAQPSLATDVREYVISLRTKPERDFRPQLRASE